MIGVRGCTAGRHSRPAPRRAHARAAGFRRGGGRAFVDITAVLRNPIGRDVALRALSVMEARTAVVLRGLLGRPARSPPSRTAGAGRSAAWCRCSCASGCRCCWRRPWCRPPRPDAASPGVGRADRGLPRRPPAALRASNASSGRRATLRRAFTIMPARRPGVRRRLPHARRWLVVSPATIWTTSRWTQMLRSLPHNVDHRDGPASSGPWPSGCAPIRRRRPPCAIRTHGGIGRPPALADRFRAGTLPTGPAGRARATSCAATATAPSPRSTSACRGGPTTRRTCSARWPTTCGSTASAAGSGRTVRSAARGRPRRTVADAVARVRRRSRWRARAVAVRARARARAGRHARDAQGPPRAADRPRPRASSPPSAPSWRSGTCSTTADDVFFLDLREARPRWPAPTTAPSWPSAARTTTASCAAATCRGSCCPTAPSPRRWRPARPSPRRTAHWSAPRRRRAR